VILLVSHLSDVPRDLAVSSCQDDASRARALKFYFEILLLRAYRRTAFKDLE